MRRGKLMDNLSKMVPRTVLMILLVIIVILAVNIQAVKAESRNIIATCGEGYLEYVNGLYVLHVKGSPYDMGYQNGFLLKGYVQALIQYGIQKMIGMGYSYEYLANCTQAMEPHIPQEYIEEMEGLADGASMNYTDVLIYHTHGDIKYYGPGWTECSGFVLFGNATVDGHLYHGRSLDDVVVTGNPVGLITVHEPENGITFINVATPGYIGVHTGMNTEGITLENNISSSNNKTLDGMPIGFILRKVLQYANNLTQAIDIICQANRTCGYNVLLGDGKNLNAAVVEISDSYCKVFWAGDPAEDVEPHYSIPNAVRRTNHYVDPELAATQRSPYDPRVYWGWSWDRYDKLSQLIEDNYGNIDAQMSIEFLRTPPVAWAAINLMSVVFDSTDLELWVANSAYGIPAYQREFRYLSYDDLFPGYPVYLTISSTAGGNVTTPGEGTFAYDEGEVINLIAMADVGYRFVNWTGDVGTIANVTAPATNITMGGNYSITANFVAVYDLTITSTAGGTVTTPGEETFTYDEGTVVDLVAEADEGYRFVEWTAPAGEFGDANAAETTFTMPAQNVTVTANFEEVPPPPVYPTVTTQAATGVLAQSAILNMNYTVGDSSLVQVRFAYEIGSRWSYTDWVSKGANSTYAALVELPPTAEVDFKAQLKFDDTVIEGDTLEFHTPAARLCFIATAAYGTPMAAEIQILRQFRDEYLLTNPAGKVLVGFYYRVSPPIAEFITEHPSLKPIVRAGLVPAVAMSTIAVNTTPAEKMAIVGLLVLVSVALAVWVTRRRGRGPEHT